ncbi:MAG: hypothetical protein AB1765_02675 [Candidatus Hydrogenedentota bacterium]
MSYLDNSRILSCGELSGFTGYWSPAYTLLLIPVHFLKLNPIYCAKYLSLIIGICWSAGIYFLVWVPLAAGGIKWQNISTHCLIYPLFSCVIALLYLLSGNPLLTMTPDLLVAVFILLLIRVYSQSLTFDRLKNEFISGLICGLGSIVKSYLIIYGFILYLFLLFIKKSRIKKFMIFIIGLCIFYSPYKIIFSDNSVVRYNLYYLLVQRENQNDWGDKYLEPERERTHFWSNPTNFASTLKLNISLKQFFHAVKDNVKKDLFINFYRLPVITFTLLALIFINFKKMNRDDFFLIFAILLYHIGYLFLYIEERYLFASLGIEIVLLGRLFFLSVNNFSKHCIILRKSWIEMIVLPVFMLCWIASYVIPASIFYLVHPVTSHHKAVQQMSGEIVLDKNIVSNNLISGFELAFLENVKSFNVIQFNKLKEYSEKIKENNIGYYLLSADRNFSSDDYELVNVKYYNDFGLYLYRLSTSRFDNNF